MLVLTRKTRQLLERSRDVRPQIRLIITMQVARSEVEPQVGRQKAHCRERAGVGRNNDVTDSELIGELHSMQRAGTSKSHQRE